jgi:hypothetical protein
MASMSSPMAQPASGKPAGLDLADGARAAVEVALPAFRAEDERRCGLDDRRELRPGIPPKDLPRASDPQDRHPGLTRTSHRGGTIERDTATGQDGVPTGDPDRAPAKEDTMDASISETVVDLGSRMTRALLGSDRSTLEALVAPDAVIIGPKGFLIDRETWLQAHEESTYRQVRLDMTETGIVAADAGAVRVDVVDSECLYHGETITGRYRVAQAWVRRDGAWQLASIQYTPIAS